MKHFITVHIPNPELNLCSYSLYARGLQVDIPRPGKERGELIFRFLGEKAIILLYSFSTFKKAYIVTSWSGVGEKFRLPGVEEDLQILYSATGRKARSLDLYSKVLLTGDEWNVLKMPLLFWHKFAALIQCNKNVRKFDFFNLYWEFGGKKEIWKTMKK
ncbi:MAG: hypothetical protein HUK25_02075 [Treponema sp.]|nr:hypothetical protein [Treponema sp.]